LSLIDTEADENVESELSVTNHAELVLFPQEFPVTQATEREISQETLKQ
jgi:hypothetical protein